MSNVSSVHASVKGCNDKVFSGLNVLISPGLVSCQQQTIVKSVVREFNYVEDTQLGPSVHNTSAKDPDHTDSGMDGPETTELQRYWELEQSETQILDV